MKECISDDLRYGKPWSLCWNAKIIVQTVFKVFLGKKNVH
jgi:lipopolysaccharide/colanic/teichoic acid biosynthesis glycosyltransferase